MPMREEDEVVDEEAASTVEVAVLEVCAVVVATIITSMAWEDGVAGAR